MFVCLYPMIQLESLNNVCLFTSNDSAGVVNNVCLFASNDSAGVVK